MDKLLQTHQYLSFEINNECPLEFYHPQCPRNIKDRYARSTSSEPITVDDIIGFYSHCVEYHGFRGMMNFHNYNEPLATKDRIIEIMRLLPKGRFSLWTNGVLLEDEEDCIRIIEGCESVMITIYPETNMAFAKELSARYPHVKTQEAKMDNRAIENIKPIYRVGMGRCNRVNYDPVIDYYGNMHMCCADWRGEMVIGNIKIDPWRDILSRWNEIREKLSQWITQKNYDELPYICKLCFERTPYIPRVFNFHPIKEKIEARQEQRRITAYQFYFKA